MKNDWTSALHTAGRWLDGTAAYREDFILVGGFAPLFYRYHPMMTQTGVPLLTEDVDLCVPQTLPIRAGRTVVERALERGFTPT